MTSGGGGGAGKVNFNDLTVVAAIDKAAPTILKNCATGQHLSKVEISVCKAGGEQIEYSRTTLEDVLVTGVKFIGVQDNDALKMRYSFQAAKVKNNIGNKPIKVLKALKFKWPSTSKKTNPHNHYAHLNCRNLA